MAPVTLNVVTGFLGSGKSTALTHLLEGKRVGGQWACVVGEYAEEGFDAMILRRTGTHVRQITRSGVGETARSYREPVRELVASGQFSRIFIETSGVSEIDKVVSDLLGDPELASQITIGRTTVVMDVGAFEAHARWFGEQLWAQIALADVVLLNKTDRAPNEAIYAIRDRVAEHAPDALLLFTYMGQCRRGDVLDPFEEGQQARITKSDPDAARPPDFEAFVYRSPKTCFDRVRLGHLLLNLEGGQVARFKGVLKCWDRTRGLSGLPGQLDWDEAEVHGPTAIAIIGLGLDEARISLTAALDDELDRQLHEMRNG